MLVSSSPHSLPPFNPIICRFLPRPGKKIKITQIYLHSVLIPKLLPDPVYAYPTSVGRITAASRYVGHPFCKRDQPIAADSKQALIPFPVRWLSGVDQCSAPCRTTGCPGFVEVIVSESGQGSVLCVYTESRFHYRIGERTGPWTCKLQPIFNTATVNYPIRGNLFHKATGDQFTLLLQLLWLDILILLSIMLLLSIVIPYITNCDLL